MQSISSWTIRRLEAPVVPQSASLDAHLQLDEQLAFGEPLRYDAYLSSYAPASHDAPLLDDAQRAEQQLSATTEEPSSFHHATMCSTSSPYSSRVLLMNCPTLTDEPVSQSPRPARNPVRRCATETTRCNATGNASFLGEEWKM